jgi:VWFA-related protein
MRIRQILPLLSILILAPAVESQNSNTAPTPPAASAAPAAATVPSAQGPAGPVTTMSVNAKVVNLPVTVRDKKGKIVRDLTKDDFDLEEDGKPQAIRYFSQETNLPLTIGLLVDTSMSERDNMDRERAASRSFLDQMITRPQDRAFVIHFDREVELLQDLTSDHGKLEKAVGLIDTERSVDNSTNNQGSGQTQRGHGGGTALYDAIFLACDEIQKKQTGRKAIVVLSDGEDRGSKETMNEAVESAQKAETVVYTIYIGGHEENSGYNPGMGRHGGMGGGYPGGGYPGGGYPGGYPRGGNYPRQQENHPNGKKIMQEIADQTGGRYFEAKKKDSVDDDYAQIAEELRTQFMLGYTPPKDQTSGYHSIHLTTKKKDMTVQTRQGYYSGN